MIGYQLIVLRWIYPGETLLVAVIPAFVPYVLVGVSREPPRHFQEAKREK